MLTSPTRDADGPTTLLRRARPARGSRGPRRRAAGRDGSAGGTRRAVRRAGPVDLDEVVRLGLETIRYDAHFGTMIERPETPGALATRPPSCGRPDPWVWLAEPNGTRSACSTRNGRSSPAGSPPWCGRRPWPTSS